MEDHSRLTNLPYELVSDIVYQCVDNIGTVFKDAAPSSRLLEMASVSHLFRTLVKQRLYELLNKAVHTWFSLEGRQTDPRAHYSSSSNGSARRSFPHDLPRSCRAPQPSRWKLWIELFDIHEQRVGSWRVYSDYYKRFSKFDCGYARCWCNLNIFENEPSHKQGSWCGLKIFGNEPSHKQGSRRNVQMAYTIMILDPTETDDHTLNPIQRP